MKPLTPLAALFLLSACAMHHDTPKASPEDVAAARSAQATPLPAAPGVCKAAGASVCCVGAAGAGPANGTCVESADACLQRGGKVSDAGAPGCG